MPRRMTRPSLARLAVTVLFCLVSLDAQGADKGSSSKTKDTPTQEVAGKARERLETYCHRCHGQEGTIEGGFNYLLDREQLVARKKIVPGKPSESLLLRRIVAGEMPPADEKLRPSDEDLVILKRWIEAGAPELTAPRPELPYISPKIVMQDIRADLEKRGERDRRFTRYFTLTHLYNAGLSDDELQTYRNGVSKLLNSLSWNKTIITPVAIDKEKTILRIDLRDYNWGKREWDGLANRYPYALDDGSEAQAFCNQACSCIVPAVRGDWFVASASRPPLYHDLLQLPRRDIDLEQMLHLDATANIEADRVARAGFGKSGIARYNRLLERHDSPFGAYWRSYDFAEAAGPQNIFERPLGPADDEHSFRQAGSEIIFNLPNGLQAYMLVNGQGTRIDKAPTALVTDPKRPDRLVENGLSCMSCHARGIIPKDDEIRSLVEKNPKAFTKEYLDTVLALYPPVERFRQLQDKDAERFRLAAAAAGAKATRTEPIYALALQYEAPVSVSRAAAEIGLTREDFVARLDKSPSLKRSLGLLQDAGGTIARETFDAAYYDLMREWKLGEPPAMLSSSSSGLPAVIRAPRLDGPRVEIKLDEPYENLCTGGGGRFLVCYFKKAKKLSVFDVSEARVVKDIELSAEDILYACGRDKLMIIDQAQRTIQRWSLATFEREKTASVPKEHTGPLHWVIMGSNSAGPLMLWSEGPVTLLDIDKMEPFKTDGKVLGGNNQWQFRGRVSADGSTFVAWHNAIWPSGMDVMKLDGHNSKIIGSANNDGHNGRWAIPGPDARLLFRESGDMVVFDENLKDISGGIFKDVRCLPTEDPRYFLALRSQDDKHDQVAISTSCDLKPICTVKDLEKSSSGLIGLREPRTRYIPSANLLITLPESNDRIVLRNFNLMDALNESGEKYLFVTSLPPNRAKAGSEFSYTILARSKAGGLRYELADKPEGMTISGTGLVQWQVPDKLQGKTLRVIVSIKDAAGKELLHTLDLKIE
jgi:hypothetical protein